MTRSQATPASSQMITMARIIEERDETIAALEKQRDELLLDVKESDDLRNRLATLLSETAIALKGEEEALKRHSWHDLPVVALAAMLEITILKQQRDELLAALARTRNMIRSNPEAAENCANSAIASVKEQEK